MRDLTYGIQNVWKSDEPMQSEILKVIIKNIRHVSDENLVIKQVDYLKAIGAFFVPDGEYLIKHFGKSVVDSSTGIFIPPSICLLQGRLAVPMRLPDQSVIGFVGYTNKPIDWNPEEMFVKYVYPPGYAFKKSRYFFIEPMELEKAISDQYICIVDGLFDKMILQALGINAVSLCGSSLSDWHIRYLSFIRYKVVIADNDGAGRRLAKQCKVKLSNCIELQQPYTGDIDDFLKTQERIELLLKEFVKIKSEGFLISHLLK